MIFFLQDSGSDSTDCCSNPWSCARYHLPPYFTRHDVSEIARSVDVALPRVRNEPKCDAKTAVERLVLCLSTEKRFERLHDVLVLLYQKGVRIESDPSLLQVRICQIRV